MASAENQYLYLAQRIVDQGVWVNNERTGKRCLTVINADLEYDVGAGDFPLLTTRESNWEASVAEMLGYIAGFDNAAEFRRLGTKTWDKNANVNEDWLTNPNRKGEDDMGLCYGALAKNFPVVESPMERFGNEQHGYEPKTIDLFKKVIDDLSKGIDNRAEIVTFYHPGAFDLACLRPCVHSHHFSILDGTLYLNSTQRSCDVPLGLTFNMVQIYVLLAIVAQITGLKPGKAYHKIVNAHIYEDQLDLMINEQLTRKPMKAPKFYMSPLITSLDQIRNGDVTLADFCVLGYESHPPIKYPFSV